MTLGLFEGYGIEIESVVVDRASLDVRPVVDELLREATGGSEWVEDHDDGPIGWSNELVSHVVELKTNGPVPGFEGVAERFHASQRRATALLAERWDARLLPTGMHPWMDPARETRLWPHEHGPVYRAYDRLFDCRRHGWANLQSVHLNLSFASEDDFARLMAAIRMVLPLIPALAASSPVVEGHATGVLDNRLEVYRTNSDRVRTMTGDVIPEPVYGFEEYRRRVLMPIDDELAARSADDALRGGQEWTNARGAIARFDRMAIEVRLIDAQECALSDLAVAAAVSGLIRGLVEERWCDHARQRGWPTGRLVELLVDGIRNGPEAGIVHADYARAFGLDGPATMGALLRRAVEATFAGPPALEAAAQVVLAEGTLAERILVALGSPAAGTAVPRARLVDVWGRLCDCLDDGRPFRP